ncbi:MAG: 23S rRNA (guanosine(2251)-2'-O)-methyltransferase RlmB [archaeon]
MSRNIEGRNPVMESLRSNTKIYKIYIQRSVKDEKRIQEIVELAKKKDIELIETSDLSRLAKTARHQGIIAMAEESEKKKLKDVINDVYSKNLVPFFVVVSDASYEHNLGTVMRSAEAAGVHAVIISQNSFGITPVVAKSSAGASEHMTLIQDNLHVALKLIRDSGIKIVALKEGQKSIFQCKLDCPLCLIVGSEDKGVNTTFDKSIDEYAGIPMHGKISSLNMAVAASLAMFEAVRQRNK